MSLLREKRISYEEIRAPSKQKRTANRTNDVAQQRNGQYDQRLHDRRSPMTRRHGHDHCTACKQFSTCRDDQLQTQTERDARQDLIDVGQALCLPLAQRDAMHGNQPHSHHLMK
jgi:hypothetical protein